MSDNFYRAFEEKHRGSREAIKQRLTAYQPFLHNLLSLPAEMHALDLGCGRGEWIEYIDSLGFTSKGIDLDEGMLSACAERGLNAEKADLMAFIRTVASESQVLVSAFHVVEHIPFDDLRELTAESLRVLKPGGLMIFETPNPENITVATKNFYVDPTHQKPIPSELLSFVAEHAGFDRVKVIRLQEAKALLNNNAPTLNDVISGASPDYAIVAQKQAEPEIMALFNDVFDRNYGLSLDVIAERYHRRIMSQIDHAVAKADAERQKIQAIAHQQANYIHQLHQSRYWRITSPIRWAGHQWSLVKQHGIKGRAVAFLRKLLRKLGGLIQSHPALKLMVLKIIRKLGMEARFKQLYHAAYRAPSSHESLYAVRTSKDTAHLPPCAQHIYHDLQTIIANQKDQ